MDDLVGRTLPLKFGSSFESKPSSQSPSCGGDKYHTVKYDFKPASLARHLPGEVVVQSDREVTISLPQTVAQFAAGASEEPVPEVITEDVVYKGNKKPAQKECVLIIDHETGEVTLEKLESVIMVKKTRKERTPAQIAALNRQLQQQSQNSNNATDETGASQKTNEDPTVCSGLPEAMDDSSSSNIMPVSKSTEPEKNESRGKTKKLKTKKERAEKSEKTSKLNISPKSSKVHDATLGASEANNAVSLPHKSLSTESNNLPLFSHHSSSFSVSNQSQSYNQNQNVIIDDMASASLPMVKEKVKKTKESSSKEEKNLMGRVSRLSSSGSDSDSSGSSSGSDSDSSSDNGEKDTKEKEGANKVQFILGSQETRREHAMDVEARMNPGNSSLTGFDLRDDLQLSDSD